MLKVVIFGAELRGHEPHYVYHAGRAISSLSGVSTTIVLPESARSFRDDEDLSRLGSLEADLEFATPSPPDKGIRNASVRLNGLRAAIQRHRPDFVFISTGDLLAQATACWTVLPFTGPRPMPIIDTIVHGCRFAYDADTTLRAAKNKLSRLLLRKAPAATINLLNYEALERLEHIAPRLASRFELIPHPVDDHAPIDRYVARKALGIPEDGRLVGCVGVLNERKGIDLLLRAFAASPLERSDRLLLVGRLSTSLERLIASDYTSLVKEGRLLVRNRFVTGSEMAAALSAMDLVCTPYRAQHGIGSVILNANAVRRPVLSSNSGWPLMIVDKFGLGSTCDVHDIPSFATTLEACLRTAPAFQASAASHRLAAYHAPSNFAAHITRKPRELLGQSSVDERLTWQATLDLGAVS